MTEWLDKKYPSPLGVYNFLKITFRNGTKSILSIRLLSEYITSALFDSFNSSRRYRKYPSPLGVYNWSKGIAYRKREKDIESIRLLSEYITIVLEDKSKNTVEIESIRLLSEYITYLQLNPYFMVCYLTICVRLA